MNRVPGGLVAPGPMAQMARQNPIPQAPVPQGTVPPTGAPYINAVPGGPQQVQEPPVVMNPIPGMPGVPQQAVMQAPLPGQPMQQPVQQPYTSLVQPAAIAPQAVLQAALQVAPPAPAPAPAAPAKPVFYKASTNKEQALDTYYRVPPTLHPLLMGSKFRAQPNAMVLPTVDLRSLLLPARQATGSGNGYATAALREALYAAMFGEVIPQYLSPEFLSMAAMQVNSYDHIPGTSVADEMVALIQYGICPEDANTPQTAFGAARAFRIVEAVEVDTAPANVKACLMLNRPIVVNTLIPEGFEPSSDGTAIVPAFDPKVPVLGCTAVLVVGYLPEGWMFRYHKGSDWGSAGYAVMPYGWETAWLEAWTAIAAR